MDDAVDVFEALLFGFPVSDFPPQFHLCAESRGLVQGMFDSRQPKSSKNETGLATAEIKDRIYYGLF